MRSLSNRCYSLGRDRRVLLMLRRLKTSADPEGLLRALDVVEGFSGWGAPDNLYTRALMFVQTTQGPLLAWVYRYAGPAKGVLRIEGGDWLKRNIDGAGG